MMCVNVVKSQAIFKYHFRSRFDQVEGDIKDTVYQLRGIAFKDSNAIPVLRPE